MDNTSRMGLIVGLTILFLLLLTVSVYYKNETANVSTLLEIEKIKYIEGEKNVKVLEKELSEVKVTLNEKRDTIDTGMLYIARLEHMISMYAEHPAYNRLLKNDPVDTIPELDQKLTILQKVYEYFPMGNPLRQAYRITAHYGDDVLNHVLRVHMGVDIIPANPHTNTVDIYPALAGTVSEIGISRIYGKYILLEHAGDYQTFYAHLDKIFYAADWGKVVTKDTKMGIMGNTGQSTGPHLHYEIRYLNHETGMYERINPEPFLKDKVGEEIVQ